MKDKWNGDGVLGLGVEVWAHLLLVLLQLEEGQPIRFLAICMSPCASGVKDAIVGMETSKRCQCHTSYVGK